MLFAEKINCPYCKQEMQLGYLKTEGGPGLFWLPGNESEGFLATKNKIEKKGGIVLDGPYLSHFNRTSVQAYACPDCKKMIIHYE